jgi:hypothetical protein
LIKRLYQTVYSFSFDEEKIFVFMWERSRSLSQTIFCRKFSFNITNKRKPISIVKLFWKRNEWNVSRYWINISIHSSTICIRCDVTFVEHDPANVTLHLYVCFFLLFRSVYVYDIFPVLYVSVVKKEKAVSLYDAIKRSSMMGLFCCIHADLKEIYF